MTFSGHPILKTPQKTVQQIFDINDEEDMMTPSSDEVNAETPAYKGVSLTPPMRGQ